MTRSKKPKTKLKNYEVRAISVFSVLVIGAKDEKEALEFAGDEIPGGTLHVDEIEVERVVEDDELDAARRHADFVSEE